MIFFAWFDRQLRKLIPEHTWADPVYSKYIGNTIYGISAGLLIAIFYIIYGFFTDLSVSDSLINIGKFIAGRGTYYNWAIILLMIYALGFIFTYPESLIRSRNATTHITGKKLKKLVANAGSGLISGEGYIPMFFEGEWQSWYYRSGGFSGHKTKVEIRNTKEWWEEGKKIFMVTKFSVESEKGTPGGNVDDIIKFAKVGIAPDTRVVMNELKVIVPYKHYEGFENGDISITYKRK